MATVINHFKLKTGIYTREETYLISLHVIMMQGYGGQRSSYLYTGRECSQWESRLHLGGPLTELVCIPWSLDWTTPKHGLYICTSGIRSASPCAVRRDSPWRGHGPGLSQVGTMTFSSPGRHYFSSSYRIAILGHDLLNNTTFCTVN